MTWHEISYYYYRQISAATKRRASELTKFYSLLFINFKLRIYCFISDDVAMVDVSVEYEVEKLNKAKEDVKKANIFVDMRS